MTTDVFSLINKMNVKELTKTNYKNKYKKVLMYNIDYNDDEEKIIKKLDTLDVKKNARFDFTNILYLIRRDSKLTTDKLKDYKRKLMQNIQNNPTETNIANNKEGLPELKELEEYCEQLYNNNKYQSYIINYLLINLCCRNMDLIAKILDYEPEDSNYNYIVVKDNVKFIRNKYKTANKYNTKIDIFKSKELVYACKKLLNTYLVDPENPCMGNFIKSRTYNNLGQGRYAKIILKESSKSDIIDISLKRGTSPMVLLRNYDLEKKKVD